MRQRLVRIEPRSAAKIAGAMYFALGLLVIPFFLAMGISNGRWDWSDVAFALAAPLVYGLMGVLLGAGGGWLYNRIARWFGGLEVTLAASDASPSG